MSVEAQRRELVRKAAFWRFVGDVCQQFGKVVCAVGTAVDEVGYAAFYLEADAALRYKQLTGIDLGELVMEKNRYDKSGVGVFDEED